MVVAGGQRAVAGFCTIKHNRKPLKLGAGSRAHWRPPAAMWAPSRQHVSSVLGVTEWGANKDFFIFSPDPVVPTSGVITG